MGDEALSEEQRGHYRFLRQQVDKLIDEDRRTNAHPNVQQDLHRARSALKQYVKELRDMGVEI